MKTFFSPFCLALLIAITSTTSPWPARAADGFEKRLETATAALGAKRSAGKEAFFAELEVQARALLKDFPERPEPYEMLLAVAQNSPEEKSRALMKEIADSKAPAEVKDAAKGLQAKAEAVGKPLDIKFASLDGRSVDLAAMKGKVVLVDFWATWCGPCVKEIPSVKKTYEKLHPKGFEIIGISFDQEKTALEKFVKEKEMPWPQYFDGKGWKNDFGQKYGINSIPAMWLVDKSGNLRDLNGREDLDSKVEKLLAE